MHRLVFKKHAREDLADIWSAVQERSGRESARRLTADLRGKCRDIAALSSQMGRPRDKLMPGARSVPHKGYLIFLRYLGGAVEVIAIIHGARDLDAAFKDRDGGET